MALRPRWQLVVRRKPRAWPLLGHGVSVGVQRTGRAFRSPVAAARSAVRAHDRRPRLVSHLPRGVARLRCLRGQIVDAVMNMYALIEDAANASTDWQEKPDATRFLAELDAAERSSDAYSGRGWDGVAESFASHASECEMELEQLRSDALDALADATGASRDTDDWHDARDAADDAEMAVKEAIRRARRDHAGDALFERQDAA